MTMRVCLMILAVAGLAVPVRAGDNPIHPLDTTTLRKLTRVPPYRAAFANGVTFRLPDQLRYVTQDKLEEFCERMKLAFAGDELGAVIAADLSWFTIIHELRDDPLQGMDRQNLNKVALMVWLENFTTRHSPRVAGSTKLWRIVNWTSQPHYDPERHILTLSIRLASETGGSKDLKNFMQILYGPEGQAICLNTYASIINWEKPIQQARKLVDEVDFPVPHAEVSEDAELIYYAKMIGGGLMGFLLVFVAARAFFGKKKRRSTIPPRITLPR